MRISRGPNCRDHFRPLVRDLSVPINSNNLQLDTGSQMLKESGNNEEPKETLSAYLLNHTKRLSSVTDRVHFLDNLDDSVDKICVNFIVVEVLSIFI